MVVGSPEGGPRVRSRVDLFEASRAHPVTLPVAPRADLATDLLQLCERFFAGASPAVIAELHAFLTAEGVHPATALGWFTDSLASPPTTPIRVNDRAARGRGHGGCQPTRR